MRIQFATFAVSACFAFPAFADAELAFSLGLMQRSYSDDVPLLTNGFATEFLSSDDTATTGFSLDAHAVGDQIWGRLMTYSDGFDSTLTDPGGIGFPVMPGGIGLFGVGPFNAEFERDTSLLRFDVMQEFTSLGGVDLYAGASLVQISDDIGAFLTADLFPGSSNDVRFQGQSDMIGVVLGGRYDFSPAAAPTGLSFSAFGTMGVYHAYHSMDYSATGTGLLAFLQETGSDSESGMTSAAELGMSARYSLSETSEIALTYQAAFYADAINSPGSVSLTSRPSTTQTVTDSMLYQGLSLSYVMRF